MNRTIMMGLAVAGTLAFAPAAIAGPTYNSAPADGWFYGSGNNYSPSNTAVLSTDDGDQLYLRLHHTFDPAAASAGDTYSFVLGTDPVSFDWGVDSHTGSVDGLSASITLTNIGTGDSFSYDPFSTPDNVAQDGSIQNSARLGWFVPFDAGVNDTYRVSLTVSGLDSGPQSLTVYAKLGDGAAVPEPASWAMMLGGFGLVGGAMRRRKAKVSFA